MYQAPLPTANARGKFLAGPGEGLPLHSINLRFEGVILVDGFPLWWVLQLALWIITSHIKGSAFNPANIVYLLGSIIF